jgi:hypothetical protein
MSDKQINKNGNDHGSGAGSGHIGAEQNEAE